jgi:hypothetical protein
MLGQAAVVICYTPKPLTTDSNFGRIVAKPEVIQERGSRRSPRKQFSATPHFLELDFWTVSEISRG